MRTEFDGYPLPVEYDLTPAGHALVPLIDALGIWWEAGDTRRANVADTRESAPEAGAHSQG